MNSQKEKLQKIIDDIDILIEHKVKRSDSEFQTWHSKAKVFIAECFGQDSIKFNEFKRFRFSSQVHTDYNDYVQECREDLIAVKGLLESYLPDIQEENFPANSKNFEDIFTKFRKIAVALQRRYNNRDTLKIDDEYDVQDLLSVLLILYFNDVRKEEWTPSYAGSCVRMDFLIKDIDTVIEVKMTRNSMTPKKLGEELLVDVEKYQAHPNCKFLYCFVYDPEMRIANPNGIISDLEERHKGFLRVIITQ